MLYVYVGEGKAIQNGMYGLIQIMFTCLNIHKSLESYTQKLLMVLSWDFLYLFYTLEYYMIFRSLCVCVNKQ